MHIRLPVSHHSQHTVISLCCHVSLSWLELLLCSSLVLLVQCCPCSRGQARVSQLVFVPTYPSLKQSWMRKGGVKEELPKSLLFLETGSIRHSWTKVESDVTPIITRCPKAQWKSQLVTAHVLSTWQHVLTQVAREFVQKQTSRTLALLCKGCPVFYWSLASTGGFW